MTALASISKGFDKGGLPLLIGVGLVAFVVVHYIIRKDLSDATGAAGEAISGASEVIGGIATGRNVVTADTPYEGKGIFGTLGAGFNDLFGGGLEAVGDFIGNGLADITDHSSGAIQDSSGNPIATGTSSSYRIGADVSPVNAQYAASPGASGAW